MQRENAEKEPVLFSNFEEYSINIAKLYPYPALIYDRTSRLNTIQVKKKKTVLISFHRPSAARHVRCVWHFSC